MGEPGLGVTAMRLNDEIGDRAVVAADDDVSRRQAMICYSICYSTPRNSAVRNPLGRTRPWALRWTGASMTPGRTNLIALSRWRHGFESRTGYTVSCLAEPTGRL